MPHPPPGRRQSSLEEDRRETDHPDGSRQLGVVEPDPSDTVRTENHPEREKCHQGGHPEMGRARADEHARDEHETDEQQDQTLVHCCILA